MGVVRFRTLPKVLVFNRRKVQYSHLVDNRHIIFEKDSSVYFSYIHGCRNSHDCPADFKYSVSNIL
jgi:hypothetical protein